MIKDRIRDFLFRASETTNSNGMVGWLLPNSDQWEFLYPEITGYYLSWLSCISTDAVGCSDMQIMIERQQTRHVDWLRSIVTQDSIFATRYYKTKTSDWRNEAIYSFDIAMILKGLERSVGVIGRSQALQAYRTIFERMINGNTLEACIAENAQSLPDKWSTRKDVHFLKTAASVYSWYPHISDEIIKGFTCTANTDLLSKDLHPLLYYFEGWLMLSKTVTPTALKPVTDLFCACAEAVASKGLYNSLEKPEYARADVVAQFARASCLFYAIGAIRKEECVSIAKPLLKFLVERFLTEEGAVLFFDKSAAVNYENSWCSMFAWQALDLYDKLCMGTLTPCAVNYII
jgi:hypothetical protein